MDFEVGGGQGATLCWSACCTTTSWLPIATCLTSEGSSFPSAGLLPGRWQVAGRAPEALQQGGGPHTAQKEEQHAVVGDTGRPPEGNFLHQRDQAAGGENLH